MTLTDETPTLHERFRDSVPIPAHDYDTTGMCVGCGVSSIQEQDYVQRTNRLMSHMGRLKEQNDALRKLVERLWLIRHNDPTSFEWVRVMQEAERLGITLERTE